MSAVSIVNVINEWASSRPKKLTFTRTGFCFLELQHVCLGVGVKITLQAWSLFVLAQNSFFKPWLVFPWQSTVIRCSVLWLKAATCRVEFCFRRTPLFMTRCLEKVFNLVFFLLLMQNVGSNYIDKFWKWIQTGYLSTSFVCIFYCFLNAWTHFFKIVK